MRNEGSRLAFFKKRIGRLVFRTHNGCSCGACGQNYDGGVVVRNIAHAEYLTEYEEAGGANYFATKEERDEWVRTQDPIPAQ